MYVISRKEHGKKYFMSKGWKEDEAKRFLVKIQNKGDKGWLLNEHEAIALKEFKHLNDKIIYQIKNRFYEVEQIGS